MNKTNYDEDESRHEDYPNGEMIELLVFMVIIFGIAFFAHFAVEMIFRG